MYSDAQVSALAEARHMLNDVGLTSESTGLAHLTHPEYFEDAVPAPPRISWTYQPQPTHWFMSAERTRGDNGVNRQMKIDAVVYHPLDAIVEYPETGATPGSAIGHIFSVNPQDFHHPRLNIQYSLGGIQGGRAHVTCKFLCDNGSGTESDCKNEKIHCEQASLLFVYTYELSMVQVKG